MNNKNIKLLIQLIIGAFISAGLHSCYSTNTQMHSDLINKNYLENIESTFKLADSSSLIDYKITESNVLSPIADIYNIVQELLSGLTLEQHACFVNGLGFFMVLSNLNSLVSAYFGNKIIQYFELDKKYPRLAKYIEYRVKFMTFYLIFNTIFLYVLTLIFILINLYFFFN